jgi:hypothetical protein
MVFRVVAGNTIDTRRARIGDKVKMRTLAPEILEDGNTIDVGSKLEGRVMEVTSYTSTTHEARLSIRIDRLQWKKQWIPMHGFIVAQGTIRSVQSSNTMYGASYAVGESPTLGEVELQEYGSPTHGSCLVSEKKDFAIAAGMGFLIRNAAE